MLTPRLRRLQADYEGLIGAFAGHPLIKVEPMSQPPPERYCIIYSVPGLRLGEEGQLMRVSQHLVDIYLPANYPREKPYCTTRSQVFHPNFGNYICIADYWSPSQSLVDVVVQIGNMLQYRSYNTRSPLNAKAAVWATQNLDALPLATMELLPVEPEIRLTVGGSDLSTAKHPDQMHGPAQSVIEPPDRSVPE